MDPSNPGLADGTVYAIDRFLDDWFVDDDVPGASVAIVDRDDLLYATGLGARDIDARDAATAETVYGVGSIAKPVTALTVLQFVDRGDLALDDPVSEYLPVLADAPGDPVTVGGLLAHSSGLPRDYVTSRDNVVDRETLFRHVDGAAEQRCTDRDRYMYYNSGYLLLGELAATVADRPFHAVADETTLDPLGMDRSTFDTAALADLDDVATGYRDGDGDRPSADLSTIEGAGASGGLLASATDLSRLVQHVLRDGESDGERLVSSELFDTATTRQSSPLPTADGTDRGYGYGWELGEFMSERLIGHRGSIHFAGGYVGALPERGLGVALAFNANGAGRSVVSTGRGVLALAAGEEPIEQVRMLAVERKIDAVVGEYETAHAERTVTVERAPVGRISVTIEGMGLSFDAVPETADPDDLAFVATMGDGSRWPVAFRETDDDTELLLSTGKWTSWLAET